MPSAAQKRFEAKGRSADTLSTTTPSLAAAFSLNARTDMAHTGVSRLGKTFSTFFCPA